ncbi:MAG: MarR family transcriptional regulator [Alphaproteobacteria bacterium]|nr:MarR family transcriptional regulator [Alphaproteobacteria bacterium]
MADVKSDATPDTLPQDPGPDEEEIRQGIELLFYAYRDFTSDPDAILAGSGFGRAHHRVVHFVGRRPGITVAELLDILRITKQSLSRVLSQLIEQDYIVQQKGSRDRRRRLLFLTEKGSELERSLARPQHQRVGEAYRQAGPEAVAAYRKILLGLINESDREAVLKSFRGR